MPNRILKESICVSDNINMLSSFEETLFYRLIVNCDDYGRFDGRAAVLKGRLFPLRADVTKEDIAAALKALDAAGLVILYEIEGGSYIQVKSWAQHQNIRAKKAKYPAPEEETQPDIKCGQMRSDDIKCGKTPSNVPVIQSESKSESESEFVSESSSETREDDDAKQTYAKLFGNVTERVSEMLGSFDLPGSLKIHAIEQAHDHNARAPVRYIETILKDYASQNIKSAKEAEALRSKNKQKSIGDSTYDYEAIEREDQLRLRRSREKMREEEREKKEDQKNAEGK